MYRPSSYPHRNNPANSDASRLVSRCVDQSIGVFTLGGAIVPRWPAPLFAGAAVFGIRRMDPRRDTILP